MKVGKVERVLQTQLHEFSHRRSSHRILRASESIHLPDHIKSVVSFINMNAHPLGLSAKVHRRTSSARSTSDVTPRLLKQLYNIPEDRIATNETNSQCIPEFYHENWNPRDLETFTKAFGIPVKPRVVQKGTRPNQPDRVSSEASLDLQYITAMAPNATTMVWSMEGTNPYSTIDEPFFEWGKQILAESHPPYVISISYSDDEEHIFQSSEAYARSFDAVLVKMGTRGISVLIAGGDDGVAGQRPDVAKLPESEQCSRHGPQWPNGSPYITVVGATMLLPPSATTSYFYTTEEVVCAGDVGGMITAGGGFSNGYGTAPFQKEEVERYIKRHTGHIPAEFFNRSGRGYPDLSALGSAYSVYVGGRLKGVAGTSASTPTVAAMVTLWNDRRLNAGKPPLGFLNPLLYRIAKENASAFNDIVVGNNAASQEGAYVCDYSFRASSGWDAVSGLGSPNFPVLDELMFNAELFRAPYTTPPRIFPTTAVDQVLPTFLSQEHTVSLFWVLILGIGWILAVAVVIRNLYLGWQDRVGQVTESEMEPIAAEDEAEADEEEEEVADVV